MKKFHIILILFFVLFPGFILSAETLAKQLSGRILLQVESHGEAWYVNPADLRRYYLGRPDDAFNIMRFLGKGISDENLTKVFINNAPEIKTEKTNLEKIIFTSINEERKIQGQTPLVWNDSLASVAREHSYNQAKENEKFTGVGASCDYPIIHHEGLNFGFSSSDRLNTRNIYYFSKTGENIALIPTLHFKASIYKEDPAEEEMADCTKQREKLDSDFSAKLAEANSKEEKTGIIINEINLRQSIFKNIGRINIIDETWTEEIELAREAVDGWMNSEGHRRNILDSDYDEAGVGIVDVNGYMIATQVFIKRAECGYKNGACCEKQGYYPFCFQFLKCENKICL